MTADAPREPVIVTGGAGAIGSLLVRALLDRGHPVRVIDNLSSGRRDHLPSSADGPRMTLVEADLKHPESFSTQFAGAASVWHLATNPDIRKGMADTRVDLEEGTVATYNVLEAARRHDVKNVVFSSSSVVYGWATVFPTPEEYGPLVPQSLYGAAKLAAEGLLAAYANSYGVRAHIFRFANVIGPNMTHGILPDFFEKLRRDPTRLEVLGDGRQSKSYLRTEDCVEGMLVGQAKSSQPVNIFNLGTADQISALEIARKVVAANGGRAKIECTGGERGWVGDVPVQLLSIRRMATLGWAPRWNSEQAVDRTIEEMVEARRVPPSGLP